MTAERCRWCDQPATTTVEVEPIRYGTVRGRKLLKQLPITAPACAQHAESTVRRDPPQPVDRGDQATIFDFLDGKAA